MTGFAIINIGLGLAFVYTVFALLCSVLNEWIARMLDLRRTVLKAEINQLLGAALAKRFNDHPLISGLREKNKKYPSYIPPSTFALALIDLTIEFHPGKNGLPGSTSVKQGLDNRDKSLIDTLRLQATNLESLQKRIEKWFELSMEQAKGRYKRQTQIIVAVLSLIVVAAFNVDTAAIALSLYDAALRNVPGQFPIGWTADNSAFTWGRVLGLFVSAAAISLGAPFWFDIINKLVNLRQTGLPPDQDARARSMVAH
jgi:hypothetical protein